MGQHGAYPLLEKALVLGMEGYFDVLIDTVYEEVQRTCLRRTDPLTPGGLGNDIH